ncbi:hypothetical protein [Paracoccus alkenifer]|uniref:Uncharacterized protein n=1 Tax=Paracoccus alkenifer TaxID=65735 RepID=A0A1H6MP02_9RHOB|nr:hypothetical protein [Paracoccus alkenifer]SEI03573.1 hypothetical protein SAMN04488075_2348 [Paracoccus alkenifer]
MDEFARFFPDGDMLDPQAVRAAGLAAMPLPELASHDEILALGALAGPGPMVLWSHEFSRPTQAHPGLTLPQAATMADDLWAYDLLLAFPGGLRLWMPGGHEFFVLFGPADQLEAVRQARIFDYPYAEYLDAPHHSPRAREVLAEIGRRYSIA